MSMTQADIRRNAYEAYHYTKDKRGNWKRRACIVAGIPASILLKRLIRTEGGSPIWRARVSENEYYELTTPKQESEA